MEESESITFFKTIALNLHRATEENNWNAEFGQPS
jgi:hypothetical protein